MNDAILIVDAQKFFINEFTKHIPKKIANFLRKKRFDFILFSQYIFSKKSPFAKIIKNPRLINQKDTEIIPELQEFVIKDKIFIKSTFSVFQSKIFLKFLQKNNIKKLYLCGFDTDGCILITAFEGFDLGFDINVLEDLCASHHGLKYHKEAVRILQKNVKEICINSKRLV